LEFSGERDVGWLLLEAPGILVAPEQGFDVPGEVASDNSRVVLTARTWRGGRSSDRVLAVADPYGRRMRSIG
jgi:hypothetical protein